jgi:arsenate reductase
MSSKPKILFFATGNAERSKMAEAFFEKAAGKEIVAAATAVPSLDSSPLAAEVMGELGIDLTTQPVVTLSDEKQEHHPIWPFTPYLFHWNLLNPSTVEGSQEQKRQAFRYVRDKIQRNVIQLLQEIQSSQSGNTVMLAR